MLDFVRKRERVFDRCNVAVLIREAIEFAAPYLRASGAVVEVALEADCPPVVIERWQIVHALVNLLQNSVDAMMDVAFRKIRVSAEYSQGFVIIGVADTGKGIPPADRARLFQPFFTTKGEKGSGLGLYIVRRAIEEHAGALALETSERGTVFRIGLPAGV
jgi:signal transduction histidine kinase